MINPVTRVDGGLFTAGVDRGNPIDVVHLDFKKAFDFLPHD